MVGTVYLCENHSALEVFDRGAVVFRSDDQRLAQIAGQALTEARFHPFVVPRAVVPVTNLGRLTPNPKVGAHLVIVPFGEFLSAEEFLKKNDFTK